MIKSDEGMRIALVVVALSTIFVVSVANADLGAVTTADSVQLEAVVQPDLPISLFMTAEEQQAAEIRKEQNKLGASLPLEVVPESMAKSKDADNKSNQKPVKALNIDKNSIASQSRRYDGVVLRDGAVLGLWVNDQRFPIAEGLSYMKLESIRSNGQAKFVSTQHRSTEKVTASLYPGDIIPFESIAIKPISLEPSTIDPIAEVDLPQDGLTDLDAAR